MTQRASTTNQSKLGVNLIANYLGQGWSALMAIIFMPIYIKILGPEAFGLVGFYITMQIVLSIFDFGITPTLNREMARYRAGDYQKRSIESMLSTL